MKKAHLNTVILSIGTMLLTVNTVLSQNMFRSGIFLHHSTGAYIWGPNPDGTSTTTIPDQMQQYNVQHGYLGNEAVALQEEWWDPPSDNEWSTLHKFFEGDTTFSNALSTSFNIGYCTSNFKIVVVKSCYPSSHIYFPGQPSDTLDPTFKTMYNYKWHWRHMARAMKQYPGNFFVMWTNAPLTEENTTPEEAALSKSFCQWATDTLSKGLDPEFGSFPPNIYFFDYFSKITDFSGYMMPVYAAPDNEHPSGAATDLVAPLFVQEIFDAAIEYETISGISFRGEGSLQAMVSPNPATDGAVLHFFANHTEPVEIFMTDGTGRRVTEIFHGHSQSGDNVISLRFSGLHHGLYFMVIVTGAERKVVKMIVN